MKKEELSLRTKEELALSLKVLLQRKNFKKITVTDLVGECNITRPTFYYHFKDISALLRWSFEHDILAAVRQASYTDNWQTGLTLFLQYFKDNQKFFSTSFANMSYEDSERIFASDIKVVMSNFARDILQSEIIEGDIKEFLIDFYRHAITGIVSDWIMGGMQIAVEDLISSIRLAILRNASPH